MMIGLHSNTNTHKC